MTVRTLERPAISITPHGERPPAAPSGPLSPTDLGELLAAFNDVTSRLQQTHDTLRAEVARLEGELRGANDQLRRSERLAALGEMAAGIAHEVRNPLGSIRLYASMLADDLADRPDQREVARKIAGAVRGLDAVVGDVLAFARPMNARREETDASDLFDEAVASCGDVIQRVGVRVEREDRARAPVRLVADPVLLRQALVNVVRNAAEAVESAGDGSGPRAIWLGAAKRRVRSSSGATASMVSLSVRDSGPGVPPDLAHRIFNPFFTTRAAGTGLGLAIVQRIADAHGGRVRVANSPEGGAVVEILVPTTPPEIETA